MRNSSTSSPDKGSILAGLGLSLACQLFILLSLVFWLALSKDVTAYFAILVSGLLQWILVLPLVLRLRSQGKKATVMGVLIMSFLGMMLNGILLALLFNRNANSTGPLF